MASLYDHLNQWQKMGEQFSKQMAPAINLHESLTKSIAPLLATQEMFQSIAASVIASHNAWQQVVASVVAREKAFQQVLGSVVVQQQVWATAFGTSELTNLSQLAMQAAEFQESIVKGVRPFFEQLQRSFFNLPPRTQKALLMLGSHGWYMDMEMTFPDLWELEETLANGNVEEAERALIAHFERRLDEIEKSLLDKFPHRARIIKAAFRAHRREEYELSIPVLLAQTDGICKELVSQYLFRTHKKKPRTAIYVEQIAENSFQAALLSPLALTLPISAPEHERALGTDALNRHTVLHGDSWDYGNKPNSLRAISLINYVSHVLREEPESRNAEVGV